MNPETPVSIWKRPWQGRAVVLAWFGIAAAAAFVGLYVWMVVTFGMGYLESIPIALIGGLALAGVASGGFFLLRWLRHWRNLRKVLFGLACLITLIALAYAEENWRGKRAWRNFRQKWEAQGEKFDFASFLPPAVPDDKNFALTPLLKPILDYTNGPAGIVWGDTNAQARLEKISAYLGPDRKTNDELVLGSVEKGTFAAIPAWAEFYRGNTNYPQAPASAAPAERILAALGKFDREFKELREAAASRPECRFPVHYNEEPCWAILLPHLARMKALTMLTEVRATAELEAGRSDDALADLELGWRFSSSTRNEPFLICHLVRLATVALNLQTIREGLRRHAWTEAQLVQIEAELSKLDLLAEYKSVTRGERAFNIAGLEYLRRQGLRGEPLMYLADTGGSGNAGSGPNVMPSGWFYQNMLAICLVDQDYALPTVDEKARRVFPEVAREEALAVASMRTGPYNVFAKMLLPAYGTVARKDAHMQTYVDAARIGCALERYRLANGKLPDAPEALAPRFIAAVPNDVIDGKPLRYRLGGKGGYLLYSVGWNQKDDGGEIGWRDENKERRVDLEKGDWVWSMVE